MEEGIKIRLLLEGKIDRKNSSNKSPFMANKIKTNLMGDCQESGHFILDHIIHFIIIFAIFNLLGARNLQRRGDIDCFILFVLANFHDNRIWQIAVMRLLPTQIQTQNDGEECTAFGNVLQNGREWSKNEWNWTQTFASNPSS